MTPEGLWCFAYVFEIKFVVFGCTSVAYRFGSVLRLLWVIGLYSGMGSFQSIKNWNVLEKGCCFSDPFFCFNW